MKLGNLLNDFSSSGGDPGSYLKQELEQGLEPITKRVSDLEKKIDMMILLMRGIDESLRKLQPLTNLLSKLPIFRK